MATDIGYTRDEVMRSATRMATRNPRIAHVLIQPGDTRVTVTLAGDGDLLGAVRDLEILVTSYAVIASGLQDTESAAIQAIVSRAHHGVVDLLLEGAGNPQFPRDSVYQEASDRAAELVAGWVVGPREDVDEEGPET